MLKYRSVRKKAAAVYKNNFCRWLSITGEIGDRKGASIFQNKVQYDDINLDTAQQPNSIDLATRQINSKSKPLQMSPPKSLKIGVFSDN